MSKTNSLTAERLRELLHYDPETGIFTRRTKQNNRMKVGEVAGSPNNQGYIHLSVDRCNHKAHRLAWLYVYGAWPEGVIDHINGDKADNRICNLRDVPHRVNCQNKSKPPKHSKETLLGVTRRTRSGGGHYDKWMAQININGKHFNLGNFDSPEEAHAAYLKAKREHHAGCTL